MKNIIAVLSFLASGIGAILDFTGFLQEENLHERHDASAIRKDWGALKTDYTNSVKHLNRRKNGTQK